MSSTRPDQRFVEALVAHALSLPLGQWIEAERLVAVLDEVLRTDEWVAAAEAQLRPLLERQRARVGSGSPGPGTGSARVEGSDSQPRTVESSSSAARATGANADGAAPDAGKGRAGERLAAYVDEATLERIANVLRDLPPVPPEALRRMLKNDQVRPHLQRFFEDALERVLSGMNRKTGGLVGALGRGAFDAASRFGRKVLGENAPRMDEQLRKLVQSAVAQSLSLVIEQLATKAAHPKTQAELRARAAAALPQLLRLRTLDALDVALALPLEQIALIVSAVIHHNLARPEIRQVVVDELGSFVASLGDQPLRAALGERADTFATAVRQLLEPLFESFFGSEAYSAWLATTNE